MVYFPYSFLRQHYLDQVCGFVLSQCWAPLEYFSSCCESYNPKRLANVVKKNNLAFIIYFFLLHLQKDSIIMAKNNYTDDKSLNRGIAITSILLLIVVGSVIAFIIYIRGVHSARPCPAASRASPRPPAPADGGVPVDRPAPSRELVLER